MTELDDLRERAKELRCLYAIDSVVSQRGQTPGQAFLRVLQEIPAGWEHPESTGARIEYLGRSYVGPGFAFDGQLLSEPIRLWGTDVGRIQVSARSASEHRFLSDEIELLRRIAKRLGDYLEWKHTELLEDRIAPSAMHWAWRQRFADALAQNLDVDRFGVLHLYLGGSTASGDAGSGSDIDLYIRFEGSEPQKRELLAWIEGWSLCLAQIAFQQTGVSFPRGILNVKWLTGELSVWQRAELQELPLRASASDN